MMDTTNSARAMAAKPPGLEPARRESMTALGEGVNVRLAEGIHLEHLVGAHNGGACGLTTGLLRVAAGTSGTLSKLRGSVALTVLTGGLTVQAAERAVELEHLDCLTLAGLTSAALTNGSENETAVLHVAIGAREVNEGDRSDGTLQVRRHAGEACYELAPGTRFQDYFNRTLGFPALSGGYGRFEPGARLPCHLHDFDESITIIEGTATCVVEGRRYSLSDNATALVPRGRCHYFMNEGDSPMAMIWVYAGPMPERTLLSERCCAGDPWA